MVHKYLILLTKWQKSHRLVGSVESAWMAENVVIHSLCFLDALPSDARNIADVGSGAGLPGIPIAIVRRDLEVTLVESRQRRASFLSTVVRELELETAHVANARVEDLGPTFVERFDAAVMRCTGGSPEFFAEVFRIVRPGGVIVTSAHAEASPPHGVELVTVPGPAGAPRSFHRLTKR